MHKDESFLRFTVDFYEGCTNCGARHCDIAEHFLDGDSAAGPRPKTPTSPTRFDMITLGAFPTRYSAILYGVLATRSRTSTIRGP